MARGGERGHQLGDAAASKLLQSFAAVALGMCTDKFCDGRENIIAVTTPA
jgi:hypothetical protein